MGKLFWTNQQESVLGLQNSKNLFAFNDLIIDIDNKSNSEISNATFSELCILWFPT